MEPSLVKIALRLTPHVEAAGEFPSAETVAKIALAAETAGFDAVYVTDHPAPPGTLDPLGGHHDLEPFTTLAFTAARTTRIRLLTYLCVLPYRNPFITAKLVGTLDHLSQGRLILGVGTGYLEEEFAALGVDFDERNDLADEALDVLHQVWTGRSVAYRGRYFDAPGNLVRPTSVQQPHPPVWVGGNSRRAIRRAVVRGDGWMPMPTTHDRSRHLRTPGLEDAEELRARVVYLREYAEEAGRSRPLEIVFTPRFRESYERVVDAERLLESAALLRTVGVTYAITQIVARSFAETVERIAAYGETVIPGLKALDHPPLRDT